MIGRRALVLVVLFAWVGGTTAANDDWEQLLGNAHRSGNAPNAELRTPLVLAGAVPCTDGLYASPVVAGDRAYFIDGSGVVFSIRTDTLAVAWRFDTAGGATNCNNVASPAIIGRFLHVATTGGRYYVLDRAAGSVVREIDCGEPILTSPLIGNGRAYFATLGARVHAVEPDGSLAWTWDFVREVIGFEGNRWSGEEWLRARPNRVTWRDHFVCSRDLCLAGKTIVIPAGGRTVFLDDTGAAPALRAVGLVPDNAGSEYPATFGQSADERGNVYVQWHRRDNAGQVDVFQLDGLTVRASSVKGTETAIHLPGHLSFASVAVRDANVFRVRPEDGMGLCRHAMDTGTTEVLAPAAAIAAPIITRSHAVYGGLDGRLHVVPLDGGPAWSIGTAFGSPISAPPAVARGKVLVPCEDGYLYVYASGGAAESARPTRDLEMWKVRRPLSGPNSAPEFDWFTNYGDFASTNANDQGFAPPMRMRWARRIEGTIKHLPVCGGGRVYLHTAEGQVLACEQETGRLLWRRFWPGVHLSFTSPLYHGERLLVPQAGMGHSRMRCLDAATGRLLWEAPFTGSPSWSRQFPPVVHGNLAIYASGSGEYAAQGTEKAFIFRGEPAPSNDGKEVMSWIYSNDNPYYPKDNRPLLWAWDLSTGRLVWQKDFSEYGRGGNDCGLCLLDGRLYYSTFFGYSASARARRGLPPENNGMTACLDPETGDVSWLTTEVHVTAKCTLSGRDGRIYVGGNNPAHESTKDRYVWCLDALDGSLVWKSDPITSALNVVTVGERFVFSNALRGRGNVFDRETGRVVGGVDHNYACCRFTMSGTYILGANMDVIDLARNGQLVSTGPAIDSRECLGAIVSNGSVFYASQASGLLVSQAFGARPDDPHWRRLP
ncbi:MAG: hypothetical protein FJ297_13600 [Planctomycetes bacterium]|nr:hypothetical protein [Planctomycetota bacterium]